MAHCYRGNGMLSDLRGVANTNLTMIISFEDTHDSVVTYTQSYFYVCNKVDYMSFETGPGDDLAINTTSIGRYLWQYRDRSTVT